MPSGSQDDQQVPTTSLGLSYQAVPPLPGPIDRVLSEDNFFHLGHADTVAGDMLLTAWLDNEIIDRHNFCIFSLQL